MYNVAVHINNPDVERLISEYQKQLGSTKTEAVRHALELALRQERSRARRERFLRTAQDLIREAREQKLAPYTKEESDSLFEERN
jgi:hypothetical protein